MSAQPTELQHGVFRLPWTRLGLVKCKVDLFKETELVVGICADSDCVVCVRVSHGWQWDCHCEWAETDSTKSLALSARKA